MKLIYLLTAASTVLALPGVADTTACAPDPAHPFPACATTCMADAIEIAGCAAADYACQCKNFASLRTAAEPCIDKACGAQAADVAAAAQALCMSCM